MDREYPTVGRIACVNGFILKIIAVASMLTDHIGAILFPYQMVFRYIGRIAFPIFVFLLVEGFVNTKNVRRYELRLLVFALISEIPFDMAFNNAILEFSSQNVFFTLLIGLVMLDVMQTVRERRGAGAPSELILEIIILIIFVVIAFLLRTDYSGGGVLLIYCFYKFRDMHLIKYVLFGLICYLFFGLIEMYALLAVIPLLLYNGKRGFRKDGNGLYEGSRTGFAAQLVRYLFYIFYPVHLLILHFIAVMIR